MENSHSVPIKTPPIYAGFWLRFAAHLLDSLTLGFPVFLISFFAVTIWRFASATTANDRGVTLLFFPVSFLIIMVAPLLYFALMESSSWKATIGKKIVGLYVTDIEGRRLTMGRATGRTFAKYLSSMTLGVGYILSGFTEKKQALHDLIAKYLVLRRPRSAGQ